VALWRCWPAMMTRVDLVQGGAMPRPNRAQLSTCWTIHLSKATQGSGCVGMTVTPRASKTAYTAQLRSGTGLHMRSTSLALSSSLRVKGLTQRCYVWNNKTYELALTLLDFQGGTKPTNNDSTCATWATWANFTTTIGY
jgi:hypothetical protein